MPFAMRPNSLAVERNHVVFIGPMMRLSMDCFFPLSLKMWLATSFGFQMCVGAGVLILGKRFVPCTGLEICERAEMGLADFFEIGLGVRDITNGLLQVTLCGGVSGDTTLGDGLAGSFCTRFCFMLKVCSFLDSTLGGGAGISVGGSGGMIGKCVVEMGLVEFFEIGLVDFFMLKV